MPHVGNSNNPGQGYYFDTGVASCRGSKFTMPAGGGFLTDIHAYFSAQNNSATGFTCVWDSGGNLLASVNVGTIGVGSDSIGAQAWRSGNLSSPVFVAGGATIYIGFSLPQSAGAVWTWENASGNVYYKNSGNPGSLSTSSTYSTTGPLGAYSNYTPGQWFAYDGASWDNIQGESYDGSNWQFGTLYAYDGTTWQQVG